MVEIKWGAAKGLDWFDWSLAIAGVLAWPIVVLWIALAFRPQIADLIKRMKQAKYKDVQVDFSDALDQAEATVASKSDSEDAPPTPPPNSRFQQLLEISPSAAVVDAWKPIENTLRAIFDRCAYESTVPYPAMRGAASVNVILKQLADNGVLSPADFAVLKNLNRLRSLAAHSEDVSPTDAIRFQALAEDIMRPLEIAKANLADRENQNRLP